MKRGSCQPTPRTQGSEPPLAIRGLRLNWQAISVRRLSVPVPCRFSCKAGSPETKLQFGQLLRGPRIRAKGAVPLAVSKWTDSLCVLARGLSPPFLPCSALLWVTAAQFLRAAEVSLTVDSLSAPAGVMSPLGPQVLLPSGSQPGSDNITSSLCPSSLVGKVAGLWVPFCLLAASQPSPPCSQIPLGHSWTHSGFTHPGWTLIGTGSLSSQGQVCPAPHWAAEWDLVLEPMWSVRQTQSLVSDRTRFKSECHHEGSGLRLP